MPRKTAFWEFLDEDDYPTVKAAWQRLDPSKRVISYFLEDTVYLLYRTLGPKEFAGEEGCPVVKLVLSTLEQNPPRVIAFDQSVLYAVISALSLDDLVKFYKTLKRTEHPINANTLQHMASRLAKSSSHKIHAADVICSLAETPDYNINLPAPASICSSLLTLDPHQPIPEGQAQPDMLFRHLLENGFRPNLLTLTALIRNFCVRGRLDTAWKIFDLLLEHNFEPDPHVFSILLNGSKKSFEVPSIRKIIEIVFSRDAWTGIIVYDFLDIIYRENDSQSERRRRQKKANNAWRPMLQLYAKFFDLSPLQKFFVSPLENVITETGLAPKQATVMTELADALRPLPDHMLFKPTGHTLVLLLAAHARSIDNPASVVAQYRRFTRLLDKRDPIAATLIADKGTMVYDIYLRAMMQFKDRVETPMKVIYTMMIRAEQEWKHTGKNVRHPLPSVYTWTILLNGFKNHKHIGGALAALDMMLRVGNVQPNLVTWNALISAYAHAGRVHGAVRAVRMLEEAGHTTDDFTVKAFGPFSRERREYAIKLLAKARAKKATMEEFQIPEAAFGRPSTTSGGIRPVSPQAVLRLPGRPKGGGIKHALGPVTAPDDRQRSGWPADGVPSGDGGRGAAPPPPRPQQPLNLTEKLLKAREEWNDAAKELAQRRENIGAPSRPW
ncbi:hypothetical protein SLS62_001929 [Diatrype stigma]|uniref:Pentatricopeptide repeat-containing protein n=1 Tax=Diatrype stigma TaxID=117547 RepID=A0AAN9YVC2_9PEZI